MKVAIIGAGSCGLTSVKCCLDEGLAPVCFEKGSDLGGLWRYTTTEVDHACVYKSCVMVTSKEMSCFSDFPVPKEYPLYLPHSSVKTYLDLYADNFNLRPYIRYNSKVLKLTHVGEQWKVTYQKRVTHEGERDPSDTHDRDLSDTDDRDPSDEVTWMRETESFDAVLICSGHHWKPSTPKLVGADKFMGKIIHSNSFKDVKDFHGKNVLVVGIGDSGAAIASDLSHVGGKVYLSTRRGSWITSRLQPHGIPSDQFLQRRFFFDMPKKLLDWTCMKLVNMPFDHHDFGLLPRNSYLEQPPVVNDYLPYKILSGSILVKPDVVRLAHREAHFEDGSVAENLDAVVLATGYHYEFPFLENGCVEFKDDSPILYKNMFRAEQNPTLAFIGCLQPVGCMYSVAEVQARLATRVFKGEVRLPDVQDMKREIEEKMARKKTQFYNAKKHATNVYFIPYCNELAEIIGCKPRLGELLFSDPLLAYRCYFGPCSPPQYRLTGPGAWSGARQAIMALPERNVYQMKKKDVEQSYSFKLILSAVVIFFVCLLSRII